MRDILLTAELDPPVDDRLVDALVSIWMDVTEAGGAVGFVAPVSEADVRPVAQRVLEQVASGTAHLIVLRNDSAIAGFSFLVHRPGPLFRHWATIKNLQVHPSLQRRGIGSALLHEVESAARGLGLEQLHLTVRGGTGIEGFYERHGYEVVARIDDMIRIGPGDDRDELYLRKYL